MVFFKDDKHLSIRDYQNDRRCIKHIGTQQFGMKFLLRSLYAVFPHSYGKRYEYAVLGRFHHL